MPPALSVHNFISSVGADAGFASIIGLAILVLLYFAHARETSNLHEEAAELSERLLQAETRLAQLSRQQPVPAVAPAPASAGARVAGAAPPITAARASAPALAAPAAPAGVGAPPLAAATRVVPLSAPAPAARPVAEPPPEPEPEPELAPAGPAVTAGARQMAAGAGRAVAASAPVRERPATAERVGPPPVTAAGAANGGGEQRVAAPAGGGDRPSPPPPRQPVQIRSGGRTVPSRRPSPPPRGPAPRRRGVGRRLALLIGALIAVAAIAVLVVLTQSGGGRSHPSSSPTTNAPGPAHHTAPAAFNPASVTVAVLNGTATYHLAARVSGKLASGGYKPGTVKTASSQTQTATVVAYLPGFRNDAVHVATALNLGPAAVQPVDQNTQAVACPQPSPCTANVVVTVGADLATL